MASEFTPCPLHWLHRSSRNDGGLEPEAGLSMATTIWKGHLSFGLVSIPVKLYRAARAEKVAFRQVHEASGSRVRQALYREPEASFEIEAADEEQEESQQPPTANANTVIPFPSQPKAVEVSRGELAKGYEYEPGRYLVLSREDMESITPRTAYEMQILEFVQIAEVDPRYFGLVSGICGFDGER